MSLIVNAVATLCSDCKYQRVDGKEYGAANLRLACKRPHWAQKEDQDADFLDAVLWLKPTDGRIPLLKKGTKIIIQSAVMIIEEPIINGEKRIIPKLIIDNRVGIEILNSRPPVDEETLVNNYIETGSASKIRGIQIPACGGSVDDRIRILEDLLGIELSEA